MKILEETSAEVQIQNRLKFGFAVFTMYVGFDSVVLAVLNFTLFPGGTTLRNFNSVDVERHYIGPWKAHAKKMKFNRFSIC